TSVSGRFRFCFLLFCLSLASVSSVRKLTSIEELKITRYANRFPRHGLPLLFWLAQNVNFDQNNNMVLNFFPNENAYGFHYFGNTDRPRLLPSLSSGQSYYSVGNLNTRIHPLARALPAYVQMHYRNSNLPERNMDRLIVSLDQTRPNRIFSLYATAHNRGLTDFNPSDTYEIDPALVSQIRQFIQQAGYIGSSKLIWKNIPDNLFRTSTVNIDICQNAYSSDTNECRKQDIKESVEINESDGSLETSVLLNAGLQPRLRRYYSDVLWYGAEVDGANRVLPIRIKGCDASLQLYTANGKACARLYVKKTFSNWKSVLQNSWVGFYKTSQDKSENYGTYQYVVNFEKMKDGTDNFDIYQYKSDLTIAPGVQIRFLLDKYYDKVLAQTTPWESDEEETPAWSFPEFFYEPDFYDANNVVPIKIDKYDAGLQLFTKEGKACARLYMKKTFKNWKETFSKSWVGFYTSSQDKNKNYDTYQYATKFEKVDDAQNFDIYQYKTDLTIAPGVQIRFLMDSGYDKQLVATEPWKSC
uniref:Uncharacterized protein n=1 Tax=Cyprinus carpio TaxID=7962 RepID=A0A8C2GBR6_CYPCA